ncbi:MAG: hypothetical protein ABIR11_11095 [Candidatus Limnocylindrales bacterium]
MMRSRTTVGLSLAGLLLVIGAGAVMATSAPNPAAGGGSIAPAAASPSAAPVGAKGEKAEKGDDALATVLDALVAKGTITAAQRTAILDGVVAEKGARNEARKAARQQLRDFLADGVITKAELAKLPADSPLRQLTTLMADGKITVDELRSLGKGFGKGLGNGHGNGWLHGADDADEDASASPAN